MNKVVLKAIQGFKDRRLPQSDVADLHFFWGEYESEIGVKAIDYSAVHVDGGEYIQDPLTETIFATKRARRIRARLSLLSAEHARVLYRVYGPWNHHAPFGRFGDLAGLIEYTSTVGSMSRAEIEEALVNDDFAHRVRMEAEKMLWVASAAYKATAGVQ